MLILRDMDPSLPGRFVMPGVPETAGKTVSAPMSGTCIRDIVVLLHDAFQWFKVFQHFWRFVEVYFSLKGA